MKKISTHIWEHKGAYFIAVMALVISTSLDMLSPQLTKRIIDDVIGQGNLTILPYLLGGILLVGVGRMIFMYVKEYTFDVTAAKITGNMRKDIFSHIQGLSAEFFDRNNTGELMARVKDDIDRIWDAIGFVGMLLIEVVIHVSLVLFCMFTLSWKLALIPMVVMAFCGMLAIFLEKKLDKIYEEISEENAKLNTVCEENLGGVRTVKAFAREKHEIQKFLSHNERYFELNMQQSKMFVKYHPYFTLVTKLLPLFMLLCGGYLVLQEEMSLGDLGAFIQYSMNIVWPMEMLGWLTNSFSSAVASNKKIKKIYQETAEIKEKQSPTLLPQVQGKITFENVDFKRGNSQILKNVSFTVEPGKTLGIMGATGSGKSSIIHLLQRLYDCNEGAILMDDVNIKDLSFAQLRGNISVVMQDVFLFSDTIKDNIKLGKAASITDEMVKTASHRAQAGSFIEKLESGYDTVIGERGVGLSGGQKQRISIARALAKGNPILIMDDSTSALDMETEKEIQETLNTLQGTTKIIIGHRVSAVRHADEIIFLKDGEIAERGTHETLLKEKGLYYETYMAQYGAFVQGAGDIA
ncbi:MAG: ABC transporter ATP-binding protein [Lachnospiraceae bacterium]|nr:ABC transporter ATP-binding protein [Lachnospiraceae bacterium]